MIADPKLQALQGALQAASDKLADALLAGGNEEDLADARAALYAARDELNKHEKHRAKVDAFVMAAAQAAEHHDADGLRRYADTLEREIASLNDELGATLSKLRELTATPEERYWDDVIKRATKGYDGFVSRSPTLPSTPRIYLCGALHENVFNRLKAEQQDILDQFEPAGRRPAVFFQCPRVAGPSLELAARDASHAIALLMEHWRLCADDDYIF